MNHEESWRRGEWVAETLKRITYKPGWELEVYANGDTFLEPMVMVRFMAPNTYNPGMMIPVVCRERVPFPVVEQRSFEMFMRWLQSILFRVERHESQEWLKLDGQIYDNPHK